MDRRLSILIFSRDDVDKALALARDIYDIADEIVLVDSSERKGHERLIRAKRSENLGKLRIFWAVALGYADPLRMYALGKCKGRWVLMLDTDERISKGLRSDIGQILDNADCSAFSIIRYEDSEGGRHGSYANWQIRLFRKGDIEFRGIIHEEPKVSGRLEHLDSGRYFIEHVNALKGSSSAQYSIMEKFLRMSYWSFNERIIENFYKVTMPSKRDRPGAFGLTLKAALRLLEALRGKRQEEEVGDFDYYLFYYLYYLAVHTKMRKKNRFYEARKSAEHMLGMVKGWQNEPDGDENFGISVMMHRIGLIRFLGLENERTVMRINRKYAKDRKKGVDLLMHLLKLRYKRGRRWLD